MMLESRYILPSARVAVLAHELLRCRSAMNWLPRKESPHAAEDLTGWLSRSGHQPRPRLSIAGDHQFTSARHPLQQSREVRLGIANSYCRRKGASHCVPEYAGRIFQPKGLNYLSSLFLHTGQM